MRASTLTAILFAAPLAFGTLTGCGKSTTADKKVEATADKVEAKAEDKVKEAAADEAVKPDKAEPAEEHAMAPMGEQNWFGGDAYTGAPALAATAALIKAGGGAENFSFQTALVSMLGEETVKAEVEKLTTQYGADQVKAFIGGMDFAVKAAIKRMTEQGMTLPEAPAELTGTELAKALVQAGVTADGTFWSGYLFDKALSHKIHVLVMTDIDGAVGHQADSDAHKVLNQAMYDVAQALGMKEVKLAPLH